MQRHIYYFIISILLVLMLPNLALAYSLEDEIKLGKEVNESILKQERPYRDEAAQKQMREMGESLVKHVKRKEIKYTFLILDSDNEMNAFAVPGGFIYYTSGLWKILTPDERAGVLAHEVIHVDQRHSIDALLKHQRRRVWTAVALVLIKANETVGQMADLVNTLHELKYSRGDERQADEMGVQLLVKANLNPAGLLMAMRKIMRMEDQAGGAPPKIFSSHPPSKERLNYLEQMLEDLNVPIPADNSANLDDPNEIGKVSSISGSTLKFTSSKDLNVGDVVWLTVTGWDAKFENRQRVPIARGKVTSAGKNYTASIAYLPGRKESGDKKNLAISMLSTQKPAGVLGSIADGKLSTDKKLNPGTRLLALQEVWDTATGKYAYDVTGYVVLGENGVVIQQRAMYAYAPVSEFAYLSAVSDPDSAKWAAAVASIGRVNKRVEAAPGDQIKSGVVYEIRTPIWDKNRKVVAKAKAATLDRKITLDVYDFADGWQITDVTPGFDIYRAEQNK